MAQWNDLAAAARMTAARSALITTANAAFWGCLALSQKLTAAPSIGTAAVDGRSLIFAPDYIATLAELECIGLVAHEMTHLAGMDHVRRGNRDPAEWNIACDLSKNPMLIKAGFTLPKGALVEAEFEGWSAEAIYAERTRRRQQDAQDAQDAQDGQDSGQDDAADASGQDSQDDGQDSGAPSSDQSEGEGEPTVCDPGMCGGVLDAASDAEGLANATAEIEVMVRQAISVAKAANGGAIPEFLAPLVQQLNAPRLDWRTELVEFIDDSATRAVDWNRPNKRFLDSGFILPGSVADSVSCVAVVVDCSGSVGRDTLATFESNSQALLDDGRVERLVVIYCHNRVCGEAEFLASDVVKFAIPESGGTAFGPAFRHIAEHYPEAAAIVYLTDLDPWGADAWGDAPDVPVLWAVDGSKRFAPFGRVLPIDPYVS